ncbi:MAG: heme A synthase [Candidatus Fonsibacter sp.]|nr:heme A synthase [Candidatus Fonsibacter sp.]
MGNTNNLNKKNNYITIWLYLSLFLVFSLIFIGGLTRLTESGLSITNWELLSGILPPLNEKTWENYFFLYKQIPQYKEINFGMSLAEFKYIFWWEYIHRLLARLASLTFIVPFLYFLIKKSFNFKQIILYSIISFLFIFQGFLGWYMVKSGLISNVDVSHFRLSAHLLGAQIILSLIFFSILFRNINKIYLNFYSYLILFFLIIVFFQIVIGAFVSGLDAAKIYQTWPSMNGNFIAEDVFIKDYLYSKSFSSPSHVQFLHRLLAYLIIFIFSVIFYFLLKNKIVYFKHLFIVLLAIIFQVLLGILVLISGYKIYLASLHQLGSIFLLFSIIYLFYQVSISQK